jgi:hypothetical protein
VKNKIEDLRNHLFDTIEALKDAENSEEVVREIDRAKAIVGVAQVIVDTAKAENSFLELSEHAMNRSSGFIPAPAAQPANQPRLVSGGR